MAVEGVRTVARIALFDAGYTEAAWRGSVPPGTAYVTAEDHQCVRSPMSGDWYPTGLTVYAGVDASLLENQVHTVIIQALAAELPIVGYRWSLARDVAPETQDIASVMVRIDVELAYE